MTTQKFCLMLFLLLIIAVIAGGLMFHVVPQESRELFAVILGVLLDGLRLEFSDVYHVPIPKSISVTPEETTK